MSQTAKARLRELPPIDEMLKHLEPHPEFGGLPRNMIVTICRVLVDRARKLILSGDGDCALRTLKDPSSLGEAFGQARDELFSGRYRRVVNATGIMLHTGLGRAPMSERVRRAVADAAGPCLLEIDRDTKERSRRETFVVELLRDLLGAEGALVLNNNAAALLIALSGLAQGREVIVSRGELVEIGGGFRVPDIMARGGAILREVGSTNKTNIEDFRRAINENTALILSVHTSNFKIVGFSASPTREEYAALSKETGIPVLEDLGSGYLHRFQEVDFPEEPTVEESLAAGIDLVCFSGDKLLGGPQAGVLVGRKDLVATLRADPFFRAMRPDKLQLAGLEETLLAYRRAGRGLPDVPFWQQVAQPLDQVQRRAQELAGQLSAIRPDFSFEVQESWAQPGSGSVPGYDVRSWAVVLDAKGLDAKVVDDALRAHVVPVFARVKEDRVHLDLRTIVEDDLRDLEQAIASLPQPPS